MIEKSHGRTRRAFWILSLFVVNSAWGDVKLPSLVGNGMVLQRDSSVGVWGWADRGENIRIEFQGHTIKTKADRSGRWSASMGPFTAGGPYEMTIVSKNRLVLNDILIGDVWLASGQSNMDWPLKWISNADHEIASANFPRIRLFAVKPGAASKPKADVNSEGWRPAAPGSVAEFSAIAYLFGRELHQRYQVPIGLIQSASGGSVAESWMSESSLRRFPEFHEALKSQAHVNGQAQAAYHSFVKRKAAWYQQHGSEDRGRVGGRNVWAEPELDVSNWPTVSVPRDWPCTKDLNGFSGVVWFRRTIAVPPEHAGKSLFLHLGSLLYEGTTYFNGEKIGETTGAQVLELQNHTIPGKYVREGRNTIAIRLVGYDEGDLSGSCLMGPESEMRAEIGGITMSLAGAWSYQPGADLRDFPVADAVTRAASSSRFSPVGLFNAMLNPLIPFRIKGVIWYQGESNTDRPAQYRTLFPALIQDWRHQWGYELPFLFVQLAGFGPNEPEPTECAWAELREAQSMALSLPRTGMATAVDLGDEKDIHPRNKQDVAHRLALTAAKVVYGEDFVHSGPTYKSMQIEGSRIRIELSNLGSGPLIKDKYGYGRGFELAAADGKFHWAQAKRDGQDILVFSEDIQQPVAVRYGWSNTPDGNVYNREGLPLVPFRTDAPKH